MSDIGVENQIRATFGNKVPYCKVCGTECVLASDEDVKAYKQYDTTYPYDFIYVPACECWKTNDDWMEADF